MDITYDDLDCDQQKAFDLCAKDELDGKDILHIVGFAGTGKTTLLTVLAKHFGGLVDILTPTNKAAQVLRDKGVGTARTVHSALYMPQETVKYKEDSSGNKLYEKGDDGKHLVDEDGRKIPIELSRQMSFGIREDLELPPMALVDEASMLNAELKADIENSYIRVVYFGDGFQLPPVGEKRGQNINDLADIFLDKVHRVALENPITQYATLIRNGEEPEIPVSEFITTCSSKHPKLYSAIVKREAQAICWTNRLRHTLNTRIRNEYGFKGDKVYKGEKIISLQNVRTGPKKERVLLFYNGEVITPRKDVWSKDDDDYFVSRILSTEDNRSTAVWPFWQQGFHSFQEGNRGQDWQREINRRQAVRDKPLIFGSKFDYAYCLTAHKSQGSEYESVAVWDQRRLMKNMSQQDRQRWYYTAITRAKTRLLIVK